MTETGATETGQSSEPGGVEATETGEMLLGDTYSSSPILGRNQVYTGAIWNVLRDTVDLGGGEVVQREYLQHPGAVAVILLDEHDRVLLQQQYRHPVGMRLWELPAGLLDSPTEDPWAAAQRELAEEADLVADEWHVLVDWFSSAGSSQEAIRCYVARHPRPVPLPLRHERTGEERDLVWRWVSLDAVADAIMNGDVSSPTTVMGVLAARAARERDWCTLRPADSPWPRHPLHR